jgi:hypothetical protein
MFSQVMEMENQGKKSSLLEVKNIKTGLGRNYRFVR